MLRRRHPDNGRVGFIDFIKGVCILAIIALHSGLHHWSVSFMVPLFFVISGYLMRAGNTVPTLAKKIYVILIPALTFNVLFEVAAWAHSVWLLDEPYDFDLLRVLALIKMVNGPLWFLVAMLFDVLVFVALTRLTKNRIVWCAVAVLAVVAVVVIGTRLPNIYRWRSDLLSLPYFIFGYLLKDTALMKPGSYKKWWIWLTALILALVLYKVTYAVDYRFEIFWGGMSWDFAVMYLISFIELVCVIVVMKRVDWLPLINYFGEFSLIVLCIHGIYILYVKWALVAFGLSDIRLNVSVFLIVTVLCLITIPLLRRLMPFAVGDQDVWRKISRRIPRLR